MRYAHVKQYRVVNIIEWDGETEFDFGTGKLVSIEDASQVGIGWKTNQAGEWIDPSPPPPEPEPITEPEPEAGE